MSSIRLQIQEIRAAIQKFDNTITNYTNAEQKIVDLSKEYVNDIIKAPNPVNNKYYNENIENAEKNKSYIHSQIRELSLLVSTIDHCKTTVENCLSVIIKLNNIQDDGIQALNNNKHFKYGLQGLIRSNEVLNTEEFKKQSELYQDFPLTITPAPPDQEIKHIFPPIPEDSVYLIGKREHEKKMSEKRDALRKTIRGGKKRGRRHRYRHTRRKQKIVHTRNFRGWRKRAISLNCPS